MTDPLLTAKSALVDVVNALDEAELPVLRDEADKILACVQRLIESRNENMARVDR